MKKISYLPLVVASLLSSNAMAATATGNLIVKATVQKSCAVNTSATGTVTDAVIDFGTITSLSTNVDSSTASGTQLTVLCTNGTGWAVAFNDGANSEATQRRMKGPASTDFIPYNLYSVSSGGTIITTTTAYSGTGTGTIQNNTIYGRIPAGTALPSPGAYIDTVTMTVTY